LERILHAILFSIIYAFFKLSAEDRFKGISANRVSTGLFGTLLNFVSILFTTVIQCFTICIQWFALLLVFIIFSMLMYIILQYATDILFEASTSYNKYLGPSLQIIIVWPLKIFTWFFEKIIPIWNAVVWFMKKLPFEILLHTVTHNLGILLEAIEAVGLMAAALTDSFISWLRSFHCCEFHSSTSSFCNPNCFDTGERIFDFLTPMGHMRTFSAWVVKWVGEMCNILSGPLDLITFPLMDINFAKFVHFFLNSILYLIFHLPAVTYERCAQFAADGAIMCVPDLNPVFNMLTSSFHYLGMCIDNWLDVFILIIEGTLGIQTPVCNSIPSLLRDVNFRIDFFGSRKTVMIGMTEHMFARSDGLNVQYFSSDREWQAILHPNAFPFEVNVNFGLAPIAHYFDADHDTRGDDTTSLMGCRCSKTAEGLDIQCGIAMFSDAVDASNRIVPMKFQVPSTSRYVQCNTVSIRVEPIRWPVSRFTATKVKRTDGSFAQDVGCATKNTCLQVRFQHLYLLTDYFDQSFIAHQTQAQWFSIKNSFLHIIVVVIIH